jgi:hypothetical protein
MYGCFLELAARLAKLHDYHGDVNQGLWQGVLLPLQEVVAECVASAVRHGDEQEELFPVALAPVQVPEGFKQCGQCHRVLQESERNFRRDKNRKSGFRARCKRCLSTKKKRTSEEEEQEEEEEEQEERDQEEEEQEEREQEEREMGEREDVDLATEEPASKKAKEDHEEEQDLCSVCHSVRPDEPLLACDAEDCEQSFHPISCAGYDRAPGLDNGFDAYCANCLAEYDLKPLDVLWQEEEADILTRWFASPDCPFQRVEVEGDGKCALRTIWTWLQRHRNDNEFIEVAIDSFDALGVVLSQAALRCIKARTRAELPDAERRECNRIWKAIQKEPSLLKEYWNSSALDYLWIALTTHVLPAITVEIWQVSPKERYPILLQRYPDEEERSAFVLRALRSNPNIAPHYDLLVKKKTQLKISL